MDAQRERSAAARRAGSAVVLACVAAAAVYGGNFFGLQDDVRGTSQPTARPAAVSRVAGGPQGPAATTVLRSQPWWQTVRTLQGSGAGTQTVTVDPGALQWRARWSCNAGHLTVVASTESASLVDARCPGRDTAYAVHGGKVTLQVAADGPWTLAVDQQVDVPLQEAPLPAMSAPGARVVSTGTFYNVDQSGSGTVTVYRLPDSTRALRLDGFFVTANTDLEIRFSSLPRPQTTDEYSAAPSAGVAPLDVTAGSMNFSVPASVDPTAWRSVVIWCERLHSAYAAATLGPPA